MKKGRHASALHQQDGMDTPIQSSQAWIGQPCCGLALFIISPVCTAGVGESGLGRGRDRRSRRRVWRIGPGLRSAPSGLRYSLVNRTTWYLKISAIILATSSVTKRVSVPSLRDIATTGRAKTSGRGFSPKSTMKQAPHRTTMP